MLLIHLLISLVFLSTSATANLALVDRQILEVEANSYTQRQFEIYFLVKQLLLSRNAKPDLALHQGNWEEQLQHYKSDILINQFMDQEAQRLSSLFPSKSMLETAYEMVQNRSHKVTAAQDFVNRLQIQDEEMKRALVEILKVQSYLKSRVRLLDAGTENQNWGYELDEKALWFTRIEQSYRYRYFDNAREYREIRWE